MNIIKTRMSEIEKEYNQAKETHKQLIEQAQSIEKRMIFLEGAYAELKGLIETPDEEVTANEENKNNG